MSNILPLPPSTPPPLDDTPSPGDDDEFGDFAIAPLGPSLSQETQVSKTSSDLSIPSHHSHPSYPTSPPSTPVHSIAKEEPPSSHSILIENDEEETIYLTFAKNKRTNSFKKDTPLAHPPTAKDNALNFRDLIVNDKELHLLPESSQTFHSAIYESKTNKNHSEQPPYCDGSEVTSHPTAHLNESPLDCEADLDEPNDRQSGDIYTNHYKGTLDANEHLHNQGFHGDCDIKKNSTLQDKLSSFQQFTVYGFHEKEGTLAPLALPYDKVMKHPEKLVLDEPKDCQTHLSEPNAYPSLHIRNSSSFLNEDNCDIENNFKDEHCDLPHEFNFKRRDSNSTNLDNSISSFSKPYLKERTNLVDSTFESSRVTSLMPSNVKHINNFDALEIKNKLSNFESFSSLDSDDENSSAIKSEVDADLDISRLEQDAFGKVVEPSDERKEFQNNATHDEPNLTNAMFSLPPASNDFNGEESGVNQSADVTSNHEVASSHFLENSLDHYQVDLETFKDPSRTFSSKIPSPHLDETSFANDDDDDDFADFEEAYPKPLESLQPKKESNAFSRIDEEDDGFADFQGPISESDGGDWANFESCPTFTSEQPEFADFKEETPADDDFTDFKDASEDSLYPKSTIMPSENISIDNMLKSAETLAKVFFEVFPFNHQPTQYLQEDFTFPPLVMDRAQEILEHLQDTENTPAALRFIWARSQAFQLMLSALHIDSSLLTPSIPLFATGLGLLEPTPIEPSTSFKNEEKHSSGSTIPEVQYDWSQNSLMNPHRSSSPLNLDLFVAQGDLDQEPPSSGMAPSTPPATAPASSTRPKVPSLLTNLLAKAPPAQATEELSDEARSILDRLPDLSFMTSPVLMFPILHP